MAIRPALVSDLDAMLAIYAPYVTDTAYTFDFSVPTREAFSQKFQGVTAGFPWLVCEEAGRILGFAYAGHAFDKDAYQWCAEVTVYLPADARGKGIGSRLYRALEKCLTLQGYRVAYARITGTNAPSLAFHEKAGYRVLAEFPACGWKQGKWHNVVWMEKRLNFVETPITPPMPWQNLVNSTEIFTGF